MLVLNRNSSPSVRIITKPEKKVKTVSVERMSLYSTTCSAVIVIHPVLLTARDAIASIYLHFLLISL